MLRNHAALWLASLGLALLAVPAGYGQYVIPRGPASNPGRGPVYVGQAPAAVEVGTLQYVGGMHTAGFVRIGGPLGYERRSYYHHPYATSWGYGPSVSAYGPTYATYVSWYPDYSSFYPEDYVAAPVGYPYYDYSYYVSSSYTPYASMNPLP